MGLDDANHGDIVETFSDGVPVKLAIDPAASSYRFMSERLYFVRWGTARFLVPESQMLRVVNNYNEGGYAREAMFGIPRRRVTEAYYGRGPTPAGAPELPMAYAKLLLVRPIALKVTAIEARAENVVTGDVKVVTAAVTIEGGTQQGGSWA